MLHSSRRTNVARRLETAVEIERRDQRLAGIGEQRRLAAAAGLLLAAPEDQVIAEIETLGDAREAPGRDQRRLDLRLLPFVELRILAIERVRDHEPEHGVAEELERLVVDHAAGDVLVRARSMRQRVLEQPAIAEAIAEPRLQLGELVADAHHPGPRRRLGRHSPR